MLLARDAPGDRLEAERQLRSALERADALGLAALAKRVAAALRPLGKTGGSPPAADGIGVPDFLTAREIDVLRLLAIGRGNADIALVLDISLNTVATHVRNILAKTGCANRTEAAAYAIRRGIQAPQ
jgi:DNA-binding NarL/FixJ family response regulator